MPRTLEQGFGDFHSKLKLVKTESEAVKSHRSSIETCLKNNFGMNRFFRTGSIGNGTNVNGFSDTDYFAGIHRENLRDNSATTLRQVKEVLENRFSTTAGIRVDSPAVVIPFGTSASETTEIIPADYLRTTSGVNIYDIPDGKGGWMQASPKAHKDYVTDINAKLSYKVKPLIRFVKAWKFYNNVPVSSFYLEMRVAKFASSETSIAYSIDLRSIFKHLVDIDLAAMNNPAGIPGSTQACRSAAAKVEAMSKLNTALRRANNARDCESSGNIKDAFYWWNLLFDHNFTSYYY
tara:strand:+ start:5866 stop:6741 length:876 start_codon:yes stop_codon:yes gene_type:complete